MNLAKISYGVADTFGSYLLGHSNITKSIAKQFKPSTSWKNLTRALNSVEESKGSFKIQGDKLKELLPEGLKRLLDGSQNPVANVVYRAGKKSKYNIAALRITDGDRVIATGAMSVVKPGQADSIVKARLNIPDAVQANGYLDGSNKSMYSFKNSFSNNGQGCKFEYLTGNVGTQIKLKWGDTWDKINICNFMNNSIYTKYQKISDIVYNSSQNIIDNIRKFLGN